jgi:hypothetical protein
MTVSCLQLPYKWKKYLKYRVHVLNIKYKLWLTDKQMLPHTCTSTSWDTHGCNYSHAPPDWAAVATCCHLLSSDVKASSCKFILSCCEPWRTDGPGCRKTLHSVAANTELLWSHADICWVPTWRPAAVSSYFLVVSHDVLTGRAAGRHCAQLRLLRHHGAILVRTGATGERDGSWPCTTLGALYWSWRGAVR